MYKWLDEMVHKLRDSFRRVSISGYDRSAVGWYFILMNFW